MSLKKGTRVDIVAELEEASFLYECGSGYMTLR